MQWESKKSCFRFTVFMLKLSFEDQFLIIISQIQSKDPKSGFNKNPKKYLIKQLFGQGSFISEME